MKNKIEDIYEMKSLLSQEWLNALQNEFNNDYWNEIIRVLNSSKKYLPRKQDLFNALNVCSPNKVKVIILGQDPYIHEHEAHGFSFSVPETAVNIPPSLRNIFKELENEYNVGAEPKNGCLIKWAKDGVLLLNSILSVEEGKSRSHKNIGWEQFTAAIIRYIDLHNKCVFMAWGRDAENIITQQVTNNKILTAGHPSPLNISKPFVGCGCFRECNEMLKSMKILPVRWLSIYTQ